MDLTDAVAITFNDGALHTSVEVAGEFSNWKKIPMVAAIGTFYTVHVSNLNCDATYMYKFVVDDVWQLAQDGRPSATDLDGNINHLLTVSPLEPLASNTIDPYFFKEKAKQSSQKSVIDPEQSIENSQPSNLTSEDMNGKKDDSGESRLSDVFTPIKVEKFRLEPHPFLDSTVKLLESSVSDEQSASVLNEPAVKLALDENSDDNEILDNSSDGNWLTRFWAWLLVWLSGLLQIETPQKEQS
jgi:hypothetical protein